MGNKQIIIIIGIVMVMAISLIMMGVGNGFDWYDRSLPDDSTTGILKRKQPYGLDAMMELMSLTFGDRLTEVKTSGLDELANADPRTSTYVFVGNQPYYDTLEFQRLITFVRTGGKVFISSMVLSDRLEDTLMQKHLCADDEIEYITSVGVSDSVVVCQIDGVNGARAEYAWYEKNNIVKQYHWPTAIPKQLCAGVTYQNLGSYVPEGANFAQYTIGEGHFLWHTVPLVFTNFHLRRKDTRRYIDHLFGEISSERIIYDRYAKTPEARRRALAIPRNAKTVHNRGILSAMLREPAMAHAWYLLLSLVCLFFIFGTKREQRQIPVIPPLKNQSLAFLKQLARLQFRQENYQAICRNDMRYFLNTVRERTNISIPMRSDGRVIYDKNMIDRIAGATRFPAQRILEIFTKYEACSVYAPNGEMMADLHMHIEQFIHFKSQMKRKSE